MVALFHSVGELPGSSPASYLFGFYGLNFIRDLDDTNSQIMQKIVANKIRTRELMASASWE
jgi:hypothetical protein